MKRRRTSHRRWGRRPRSPIPTWIDHLYSCQYGYPTGSMELSVKELLQLGRDNRLLPAARRSAGQVERPPESRPGRLPDDRRLGGGAQGLEGPAGGHRRTTRPVRRPGDQFGGRGGHRGRRHPRMLGRRLTGPQSRGRPGAQWPSSVPGASGYRACDGECDRRAAESGRHPEEPRSGERTTNSVKWPVETSAGAGPGRGPVDGRRSPAGER